MAHNEKAFQAMFNRSFKELTRHNKNPYYYHKIRDDGFVQPFDAFGVYNHQAFAFEYKMNKAKTTINMAKLFSNREHQIRSLEKFENAGGLSFILINWFIPRKLNKCFVMTTQAARELLEVGTIKYDELEHYTIELERKKDSIGDWYWDLTRLFNNFI